MKKFDRHHHFDSARKGRSSKNRSFYRRSLGIVPVLFPKSQKVQKVVIRAAYTSAGKEKLLAHVKYFMRPDAEIEAEKKPEMFGNSDIKEDIRGEKRFWKFIVSPENGEEMGYLKEYTRDIMAEADKILQEELKWSAVTHNNTDNIHVHVVVRGVTKDGKELIIDPRFIQQDFRNRAQYRATEELGYRNVLDIARSKTREVTAGRETSIDRGMINRMMDQREETIRIRAIDGFELERLKYLTTISLAKKDRKSKSYFLEQDVNEKLRTLSKRNEILNNIYRDGQIKPANLNIYRPGVSLKDAKVIKIGVSDELFNKPYVLVKKDNRHIYIEGQTKDRVQRKINSSRPRKKQREVSR